MKTIVKPIIKKSYRLKLLAASIAAVCTVMVAASVTRASDIDIYQEAQSGTITLMFMLDTSNSMYVNRLGASASGGGVSACDIGSVGASATNGFETTTTARPYARQYCTVASNRANDIVRTGVKIRDICTLSGSSYRCYDRITRLKDGMYDLLYGNTSDNITRLADDLIIGLSDYSGNSTGNSNSGRVIVPARRLDASVTYSKQEYQRIGNSTSNYTYKACSVMTSDGTCTTWGSTFNPGGSTNATTKLSNFNKMVSGYTSSSSGSETSTTFTYSNSVTQTHRRWLIDTIASESASGGIGMISGVNYTPTATTYVDTAAYLMGTTTRTGANSGFVSSSNSTKDPSNSKNFLAPQSVRDELAQPITSKSCSGTGIYVLTDGEPRVGSGTPENDAQALIHQALSNTSYSCTGNNSYLAGGAYTGGWRCISNFAVSLLNDNYNDTPTPSFKKVKIKTAVVGFGSIFEGLPDYKTEVKILATQAAKIAKITNASISGAAAEDVKNTAKWGILGEGGYYMGSSSQDVVASVKAFLGDLTTEIPAVTTGSPTIPRDALNPSILQNDAYYPQFQPTPDKNYQLWVGNLKKYLVSSTGALKDKTGANIIDSKGRIINNYDYWSPAISINTTIKDADVNTQGSIKYAQQGGVWSQLKLRTATDSSIQRKLLTNRVGTGTGGSAIFSSSGTVLRSVNLDYLADTTYKDDPKRGYLMSLLGYPITATDAATPANITTITLAATTADLRQVGAVMHSTPVLVTNKGKVAFNSTTKTLESSGRKDYVLFGTTQGLLHVVDAGTGEEKFAFVPNEMVDHQKEAFLSSTSTSGGVGSLYYGVDGAWALHTEYVVDSSGDLTVGAGKNSLKGKQLAVGGLRMGGRSYYGLDLSDIGSPALKFHINPTGTCSNANPLGCMGQSWSKPSLAYVKWGGVRKLVMFVGGGYDNGYESPTHNQTDSTKGAGVYMFSAEDSDAGSLLWWANANATTSAAATDTGTIGLNNPNLKYSVVSEIRTVDRDGDDLVDHLYFGDLGGQVFRVDLNNNAATLGAFGKRVQRILDLNTGFENDKRPRFYDMPSFSLYRNSGSVFAVVSIGSGNRSSPLQDYTSGTAGYDNDAVYNIYDKDVADKGLYGATYTIKTSSITKANMGKVTETNRNAQTELVAPYALTDGWYYQFESNKLQSEKVFGTPLALNYRLYVSTFDGSKDGISGDCGAGVKGESFLNRFCMPFGQCKPADAGNTSSCVGADCDKTALGAGIHTATVRGEEPPVPPTPSPDNLAVAGNTSASNYCLNTGGRTAYTPLGGGSGEQTKICLIPQRWYEKLQ